MYFLDNIIRGLKDEFQILILPRDREQKDYYLQNDFNGVTICSKPLTLEQIAEDCSLFIGAGGTMTRECAIIGIPTISVYQDKLLNVDKYLIKIGCIIYNPNLKIEETKHYIKSMRINPPNKTLLWKGKEAYSLFINEILKFNKS